MNTNITLTNSSVFDLNSEEIFLRGIPTSINVGELSVDSLRLLVFYVAKSGPYQLAVESGFFEGTLQEWLQSLYGTGEGAGIPGPKGADGKSAYELYAAEVDGEPLSQEAWLVSLKGLIGDTGPKGDAGAAGAKGDKGDKGDAGEPGTDGVTQDATTITLTNLSTEIVTPVLSTDSLLIAIGKLQGQLDALQLRVDALENPPAA